MTAFTATLPDGSTETKNSKRVLTHAVLAQAPESGSWFVARWSSSERAARDAMNTIWPTYVKRLVAVA
jgi:hypothetical protein